MEDMLKDSLCAHFPYWGLKNKVSSHRWEQALNRPGEHTHHTHMDGSLPLIFFETGYPTGSD